MIRPAMTTVALRRYFARNRRIGRHIGNGGFTLVELLVVLAILGLIAAIAVPQTLGYLGRAKSKTAAFLINDNIYITII